MTSQDDTTAGCFSGFGLSRVFRRKRGNGRKVCESAEPTEPTVCSLASTKASDSEGVITKAVTPSCCHGEWSIPTPEALPPYTASYSPTIREKLPSLSPDVILTVESKLDELDPDLRELSLKIHSHPELGFNEHYAHDTLTAFMESHNFTVTRHYADLSTAWRAEYTSPASSQVTRDKVPVLGVNSEMDALPGIGHGCGHNLIAICGVGVAVAVRHALEKHGVVGKVVLLGTPAEEGGGGKAILLKRDAYKDMDVCLMSHPMPGPDNSAAIIATNALISVKVEYFGKAAHAGAAPWEGKNALDAAVIAYSAISVLRQQFKPTYRVHGVMEGRDWAPNVIPDYAQLSYIIRAPAMAEVKDTYERVKGCFDAAASATGCSIKMTRVSMYFDLKQNSVLAEEFSANATSRYDMGVSSGELTGASTDFGNVCYELPSLHPGFAIPTEPNGGNHTIGFTRSAKTKEAHEATMKVTKGLALTGFRVLADEKFLKQVKDAFEEEKRSRQTVYTRV